jgi:hypothetical protein
VPSLYEKVQGAMKLVSNTDDLLHDGLRKEHDSWHKCTPEHLRDIFILIIFVALLDLESYFFMQYELLDDSKDTQDDILNKLRDIEEVLKGE